MRDQGIEDQPRRGVHDDDLLEGRAAARAAAQRDRRLVGHERQRHELGEAARLALQVADAEQVPGLVRGFSMCPNIIVAVERRPTPCAVRMTCSHCAVETLSGQRMRRTSSSRISAAVPGSEPRPGLLEPRQVVGEIPLLRRRSLPDLERRERVHVDRRNGLLHRAQQLEVPAAAEARVDAALQADLGGAA